ncbi:MAG: hypothetical protein EOO61_09580 [Hymenobacter sp.]|nr:MAG: hypothetical protein EOO61_09580 [Hymenobacter sp.]
MSLARNQVVAALSPALPSEVIEHLITEYQSIKQNFAFKRFRPTELDGGRFGECMLRLFQYFDSGTYTPFGTQVKNSDSIVNKMQNFTALDDSIRLFVPKLTQILMDVRNKRNVAHVGGNVDPSFSDSIFISHATDWILTELIRVYHSCSVDTASKMVRSINEIHVPIVASVDGFVRVQNTNLDNKQKVLVILYHKNPEKVSDINLIAWTEYGNSSRFKTSILKSLHDEALIHYQNGQCSLLPKGVVHVERTIPMDTIV